MGFKDYLSVIGRRWPIFLPIVVLVVGAHVLWVTFGQPQVYRATSTIGLPQGAAAHGFRLSAPPRGMEILGEQPVMEIAVGLLSGARPFASKEFEETARKELITGFLQSESQVGEPAVLREDLENEISVTISKDYQSAMVDATATSPRKALMLAWAVPEAARIFSRERARIAVEGTIAELKLQLEKLEKERELTIRDKTEFGKRAGCTNFPRYQEMIQTNLLAIDAEIGQLRGQQREIERTIDERVSKSQQGGDEIQAVATELGENGRLKDLNEQLLKVRLEHDLETSRLTDRHPAVMALRKKVDRLETLIADEQETIVGDGLKKWNAATRELVKGSGSIALKLEVLKERKANLSRELFRLTEFDQEYARIEEGAMRIASSIGRVQNQINDLTFAGLQGAGQVQIQSLGTEARPLEKQGAGPAALAMTVLLGIIFALGVVSVLEYIDTRMKNEQDVRRYLGLPLLGMIPADRNHLLTEDSVRGDIAEKFHTAATLVRSAARELGVKTLAVTSSVPGEGKTSVSVNLAVSLARKGGRVVLVDGDLRTPKIHEILGISNRTGLSTILASPEHGVPVKGQETSGAVDALVATDIEKLSVLTAGPSTTSAVDLLDGDRLGRILKELSAGADYVIFDTPPVTKVGDALTMAGLVDCTIFVVGSGICEQHDVAWAKHLLANVQANVLGVFLNRYSRSRGRDSYYYRSSAKRAAVHA